jgi:hypothetical protein
MIEIMHPTGFVQVLKVDFQTVNLAGGVTLAAHIRPLANSLLIAAEGRAVQPQLVYNYIQPSGLERNSRPQLQQSSS